MEALVRAAHRRMLLVNGLEQAAVVAVAALAGLNLLLVTGFSSIPLVIGGCAVVGAAIAAWMRARRRWIVPYRAAQLLDGRLGSADTLATAYYLRAHPEADATALARELQLAQAERLAANNLGAARSFPWRGQRGWAVAAGLSLLGCSLFALRYLNQRALDPRASLLPPALTRQWVDQVEAQLLRPQEEAAARRQRLLRSPLAQLPGDALGNESGNTPSPGSSNNGENAKPDAGMTQPANAEQGGEGEPQAAAATGAAESTQGYQRQQAAATARGESSSGKPARAQEAPSPDGSSPNNDGMLSRLRDAMSSMVSGMRSAVAQAPQNGTRAMDAGAQGQRAAGKGDQRAQAQTNAMASGQDAQQDGAGAGQQGEATEEAKAAGDQQSGRNADQSDASSRSGAGSQDGNKALRDAQQQQLMGKLAEIIGKRSANLTGDTTVETAKSNGELQTHYSGRRGLHSDLGGEINRDEIPPALRQYVRGYMERVRKQDQQ